jgi:hypothetical protein
LAILPVTQLRNQYYVLSQAFVTEVNTGTVVLYFPDVGQPANNSVSVTPEPNTFDAYGGRQPLQNMPDRQDEQGSNVHIEPPTETIPARVYMDYVPYYRQGTAVDEKTLIKTITYRDNATKIQNCIYAVINGIKVKIKQPTTFHGLFGKQWCTTIWEAI